MARWSRRRFLLATGAVLVGGLFAVRFGVPRWMRPRPGRRLGREAARFVADCFTGLDRARMVDSHVHVLGLGAGGTGCWINPEMQSQLNPIRRFQYDVYTAAVGLDSPETADADYVERLLELRRQANPAGRLLIMAFDQHVDEAGREVPEASPFFAPNDYVLRLAAEHPDAFLACASVHPYRVDALDRLDAAAAGGARAVKWLPNAMGIDPSSPRCDAFYRRLAELDLPLISHGGHEWAVDAAGNQALGNPLLLRRALDAGVRVVVAHCASFGSYPDLDAAEDQRRELAAFDLLMRMFSEGQYATRLFADISALFALNRSRRVMEEVLLAEEIHPRLLNGSDYPIPALRVVYSTAKLRFDGFLDDRERVLISEVAEVNPLLFDFAIKRSVKAEKDGRTYRLPAAVFETAGFFGV